MSKKTNGQDLLSATIKSPPHTAEELLQELQARQVELEAQNECLQKLQAVLEESLAHFVDFFEYAPIGYLILSYKGTIDEINFNGAAQFGVVRSKLIGSNLDQLVAIEDRQRWQNHFMKVTACDDKLTCEFAFQRVGNLRFDVQLDCQRFIKADNKLAVRVALTDITKRKLAEKSLRESESRHRLLVENSPVCIHEIDMEGRITSMNRAGLCMLGVEDESAVRGYLYLDAVSAADRERIGKLLTKAYAGEASHFKFKSSGLRAQIFKSCFVPIRNAEGGIEKLMGITEDITG